MIHAVYGILKPLGYPVSWQKRPKLVDKPVVSYHFFGEGVRFSGNGKPLDYGGNVQVDVFSKVDYSKAVIEIRNAMQDAGFCLSSMMDDVEELDTANELYHKIMIFAYNEKGLKYGKI